MPLLTPIASCTGVGLAIGPDEPSSVTWIHSSPSPRPITLHCSGLTGLVYLALENEKLICTACVLEVTFY